ncbi:recombinase family protein [Actinomadura terrae]|uniref:recombinase family protein n=1 Tax=Actinomadura terrae TaxID=604353 RepID=UPI001FA770AC|nr:recombinase family protein [Actinomadura terrae]
MAAPAARRPGRPPVCPPDVRHRVVALHLQGLSLAAISDQLNREGMPTPGNAQRWTRNRVFDLLHRRHVQEYIATLR